jgi:hypothetical protein
VSGSLLFAAEQSPPAQKAPATAGAEQTAPAQKADAASPEKSTESSREKSAEKSPEKSPEKSAETGGAEPKAEKLPGEEQVPEPKRAASSADKAGSPQRFNPSEQVRADFDVSFPIDI